MIKRNFWPLVIFLIVTIIYYWKIFILGRVPFPGDLLVGAYYPWLDFKWGYDVGVPVKNPLISDIFSQFFIWKSLIANAYRTGQWPLWNPYSYSGYPLLANYNSGALNPFNILMVLLGNVKGWSMLVVIQTFGSPSTMYLFLRRRYSSFASLTGGFLYGFGGFAICWQQFVNVGFIMMWLPLAFWALESYIEEKSIKYLAMLSPLVFLIVSAGHFQGAVYSLVLLLLYFLYKSRLQIKVLITFCIFVGLGVGMALMQLFPTIELGNLSVRFSENYIRDYNFGLLPIRNILTLFVPDYFGNPVTGNYWGPFNYHETVIYVGIIPLLALINAVFKYKKLFDVKFFLITAIASLLLVFDGPVGRFLYLHNIPLLSTSAAGRVSMVFAFSVAVLSGWWVDEIRQINLMTFIRNYWWWILTYAVIFITTIGIYFVLSPHTDVIGDAVEKSKIGWRNTLWPGVIASGTIFFIFASKLFKKANFLFFAIFAIAVIDMFRFGWKYTPFVPPSYVYPDTPVTDFVKSQNGIFRIAREKAQILPPNTWVMYGLASPSGYDPMAVREYTVYYNRYLNQMNGDFASRYSELNEYSSHALGEFNVRYLLAINRDIAGDLMKGGNNYYYKIDTEGWKKVFISEGVTVFENDYVKPRVEIGSGEIKIASYIPGKIDIFYSSNNTTSILLRDYYYPGWRAFLDNTELSVIKDGIFMKVNVPSGDGTVRFSYFPDSFKLGLAWTLASLFLWMVLLKYAYYQSIGD